MDLGRLGGAPPQVGLTPPAVYPVVIWVTMVTSLLVGRAAQDPRTADLNEAVAA